MAKYRKNKINAAFTEECAQILRDIKDPRVSGEMITVMSSDVSADLKFAKGTIPCTVNATTKS